jgi:hypothetical protein
VSVCMYVCMLDVYMYGFSFVCECACRCMHVYVFTHMRVGVNPLLFYHVSVYVGICMHVMYVCVCTYSYACT